MEHTYIEQFREAFIEKRIKGYMDYYYEVEAIKDLDNLLKSARTETLMECRGFVKKNEKLVDGSDFTSWEVDKVKHIKNEERDSFRTAIDNLIKKETV